MHSARLALFGCMAALGPPAEAAGVGGAIGLVSDQVDRGISVTNGRAALLTELHVGSDTGWSASLGGTWAEVDAPAHIAQLSVSAGRAWQLDADSAVQLNYVHRSYPGGWRSRYDGHDDELGGSIDWQGRCFAGFAVAPRASTPVAPGRWTRGPALYYELGYRQRLRGRLALDLGLGYADLHAAPAGGYAYGSISLGSGIGPVQTSLTWLRSRAAEKMLAPASLAGRRWVVAAIWPF